MMISRLFFNHRRSVVGIATALVLLFVFTTLTQSDSISNIIFALPLDHVLPPNITTSRPEESTTIEPTKLSLPTEYYTREPQTEFCEDRFSLKYLETLSSHNTQHCSHGSTSTFTCFNVQFSPKDRLDSFCIGSGARFDHEKKVFVLDCPVEETAALNRLSSYWYDTGPKYILDHYVDIGKAHPLSLDRVPDSRREVASTSTQRTFTYLLKREGSQNPWHCLMEIMSMTFTFDVLHMALDSSSTSEASFFTPSTDIANTQIVVVDDVDDGPYFDLWRLFSGRQPKRLSELTTDETDSWLLSPTHIILPLAGGSNSIWQNDWEIRDCTENPLLHTFVQRVLSFYSVVPDKSTSVSSKDPAIQVTLISRSNSRKLQNEDKLVEVLRAQLPSYVHLQVVDMATLSFQEQLRIARSTDVLIGVHGAGLTHLMFMREDQGAVVEIQPESLNYKGFRNMAIMRGQIYFSAHAAMAPKRSKVREQTSSYAEAVGIGKRADWHHRDVVIDEERFVGLAITAVRAVYNKGGRNYDVN